MISYRCKTDRIFFWYRKMEEIRTVTTKDMLTVYVYGEIDHHSAKGIRTQIDRYILMQKPSSVKLELSGVTFMDSSGLGLIMGRYALCTDVGCSLCVLNPTDAVARIIFMAGLEKIVPIERTQK